MNHELEIMIYVVKIYFNNDFFYLKKLFYLLCEKIKILNIQA